MNKALDGLGKASENGQAIFITLEQIVEDRVRPGSPGRAGMKLEVAGVGRRWRRGCVSALIPKIYILQGMGKLHLLDQLDDGLQIVPLLA